MRRRGRAVAVGLPPTGTGTIAVGRWSRFPFSKGHGMLLAKVIGSVIIAAFIVAWCAGKLGEIANRPRHHRHDNTPGGYADRSLHTEAERLIALTSLSPEQQERELMLARQAEYLASTLDGLERSVHKGLDEVWQRTIIAMRLDATDVTWCEITADLAAEMSLITVGG